MRISTPTTGTEHDCRSDCFVTGLDCQDRTWQVFWRCVVEGQAPSEISHDLGITPAAVRQAKSRVLRRLKEELGELLN